MLGAFSSGGCGHTCWGAHLAPSTGVASLPTACGLTCLGLALGPGGAEPATPSQEGYPCSPQIPRPPAQFASDEPCGAVASGSPQVLRKPFPREGLSLLFSQPPAHPPSLFRALPSVPGGRAGWHALRPPGFLPGWRCQSLHFWDRETLGGGSPHLLLQGPVSPPESWDSVCVSWKGGRTQRDPVTLQSKSLTRKERSEPPEEGGRPPPGHTGRRWGSGLWVVGRAGAQPSQGRAAPPRAHAV